MNRKRALYGISVTLLLGLLTCVPFANAIQVHKVHYYGGDVMSAYNTQAVSWGTGSENEYPEGEVAEDFLHDVAIDSGKTTNVFSTLRRYSTVGVKPESGGQPGTSQITAYSGRYLGHVAITPTKTSTSLKTDDVAEELESRITAGELAAPTVDAAGEHRALFMWCSCRNARGGYLPELRTE